VPALPQHRRKHGKKSYLGTDEAGDHRDDGLQQPH